MSEESNPILGYADNYRSMERQGTKSVDIWSVIADLERNMAPLMTAAQSELAALREELAVIKDECIDHMSLYKAWTKERDDLQQRLAAAEQRNADTIAKLELAASMMDDDERGNRFAEVCRLAIKSLKPTESGLSEPQCLLCLDAKTVQGNILGGFVKDCPDCCGEEG